MPDKVEQVNEWPQQKPNQNANAQALQVDACDLRIQDGTDVLSERGKRCG